MGSSSTVSPGLQALLARASAPFADLSGVEREELLAQAVRHGLLWAVADRLPEDDTALRLRFERLAAGARVRDARLREVLEEVLAALSAAGVHPVALKGPVLADRLYPTPPLRAATDLDLLVPEDQLERSVSALLAIGFQRGQAIVDAFQRRHHHHLHLGRSPGPDVELHFRPASAFGARFPPAALLERSRPHRTRAGTAIRVLAPEDELLVLVVHSAGHVFKRLGWLLELALFLERHAALDWRTVEERAGTFRCRRALAYTLDRLRALGVSTPDDGLPPLGAARRWLCARFARGFLAGEDRLATAHQMAFQLVLRDRPWGAPAFVLMQAWWVIRRRVHRAARLLHRARRDGRRAPGRP